MGVVRFAVVVTVLCAFLLQWSNGMRSLKRDRDEITSYSIELFRRDWASNMTRVERVRRAIERSNSRAVRLQGMGNSRRARKYYSSPVNAGDGAFIMQIGIGEPAPLVQHAIMDTGSDLIWIQCNPCSPCAQQRDSLYNPTNSSTYIALPCPDDHCQKDMGYSCDLGRRTCQYQYGYGDGSSTSGDVAFETFSTLRRSGSGRRWKAFPASSLQFGCGHEQEGSFSGVDGIVGLERGDLSLTSQLGDFINNKFSYCLPVMDQISVTTHLFLGDAPPSHVSGKLSTTPFIVGQSSTFYYLSLEGIGVAGKAINYPPSTFSNGGGFIIDSGTTLTYLPQPAYDAFVDALSSRINATPVDATLSGGTGLCYDQIIPMEDIPSIAFHFAGDATLNVPAQNSFMLLQDNQERQLLCLAFMNGGPAGSLSILGNFQQQNYNFVYDLGNNTLSFAPATCGKKH